MMSYRGTDSLWATFASGLDNGAGTIEHISFKSFLIADGPPSTTC